MAHAHVIAVALVIVACQSPASPPPPPASTLGAVWRGSSDRSAPMVVLLHGRGARGDDLVPLAERLAERLPDVRFVCLAAPYGDAARRYWFASPRVPIAEIPTQRPAGLEDARHAVIEWLEGHPNDRVVLAGFSQGAILSIDVALEWPGEVRGIGALSGGPVDLTRWERRLAVRAPSLFVSHGRQDPVLSFENAELVADRFRAAGADTQLVAFDGGHTIPPPIVDAFAAYLEQQLRAR